MVFRYLSGLVKNANGLLCIIGVDAYSNIHVGDIIEGNVLYSVFFDGMMHADIEKERIRARIILLITTLSHVSLDAIYFFKKLSFLLCGGVFMPYFNTCRIIIVPVSFIDCERFFVHKPSKAMRGICLD